VKSEGWVRRRCVERAGEFLAQRLSNLFGVLNIAEAAVSPSKWNSSGLSRRLEAITAY
jgi:hypothetical protein